MQKYDIREETRAETRRPKRNDGKREMPAREKRRYMSQPT